MPGTKTKIIRMGNSQGVRVPRNFLEQAGFSGGEAGEVLGQEVELRVEQGGILISPAHQPRSGWAGQFAQMAERGDDALLDEVQGSSWDEEEWTW